MPNTAYRISRAGQHVGDFDISQVRQMYASGVLLPSDHAWTEGMQAWQTLAALFPATGAPPPPPMTPPPMPPASAAPNPATGSQKAEPNALLAMVVPVGRSGWAIAAGYLGLLSLLVLPAPFAILCGVMAIKDIRKNPHKLGLVRAWFGIIAGSICLLGLLTLIIAGASK